MKILVLAWPRSEWAVVHLHHGPLFQLTLNVVDKKANLPTPLRVFSSPSTTISASGALIPGTNSAGQSRPGNSNEMHFFQLPLHGRKAPTIARNWTSQPRDCVSIHNDLGALCSDRRHERSRAISPRQLKRDALFHIPIPDRKAPTFAHNWTS